MPAHAAIDVMRFGAIALKGIRSVRGILALRRLPRNLNLPIAPPLEIVVPVMDYWSASRF
jgi:hypothetical protein